MYKILFVLLVLLSSCLEGGILNPKTGPGTPYPCGTRGHQCSTGLCCWNHQICGTGLGCPADSCCYVGEGGYMAKLPEKQWKP